MFFKSLFPANVIAVGRFLRTAATLRGWIDGEERVRRRASMDQIRRQSLPLSTRRKVLVFSFRGWYPHAAWDALLAHAWRLRGGSVHVFTCGGPLPICEVNFRHASSAVACAECALYPDEIMHGFSLPQSHLRDYVTGAEQALIAREVSALPVERLESWCFDGQPIGELVRTSVLWFARKSDLDLSGRDGAVYRDFLISGASMAVVAPRLLNAINPDVVLEVNGQFFAERILNRYVPADTAVVAYEAGWRSNTLGFDRVTMAGPVDLDDVWDECRQTRLSAHQETELEDWIASRAGGEMERDFYVRFSTGPADPLVSLGLSPQLPTAVLFTNLVWDTAVQGRNRAFASLRDWLLATITYFASRPDRQLVVRIHPAEDLRPSQESVEKLGDVLRGMPGLPPNVRMIGASDRTNSYRLMDRCQLTLTYNSTAGLEAALHGRPVVVAARVYYAERGFTSEVNDVSGYPAMLDEAFARGPLSAEQVELARRFAHLLMFRYLHTIPVVVQRPGQLPLLNPADVDLLLPGAAPPFDRLVEAIGNGHHFVTESAGAQVLP